MNAGRLKRANRWLCERDHAALEPSPKTVRACKRSLNRNSPKGRAHRNAASKAVTLRAGSNTVAKYPEGERQMSQNVSEVVVGVLEQIGVKQIFGLIGDSLNPLADAVRRSKIEWIGVRHEEGAALAATGQAKLTGRLGVCAGTTGPGSTHLVAGLYEASRDHAPVLALSGDMPRAMQGTDFIQTTAPDLLFRDVSLYTATITSPAQAAAVVHQAIAAAYSGPGVAHLTLPQDVLSAKAVGEASSVATLKPRSEVTPSEADVAEIARRIDKAESVVI